MSSDIFLSFSGSFCQDYMAIELPCCWWSALLNDLPNNLHNVSSTWISPRSSNIQNINLKQTAAMTYQLNPHDSLPPCTPVCNANFQLQNRLFRAGPEKHPARRLSSADSHDLARVQVTRKTLWIYWKQENIAKTPQPHPPWPLETIQFSWLAKKQRRKTPISTTADLKGQRH